MPEQPFPLQDEEKIKLLQQELKLALENKDEAAVQKVFFSFLQAVRPQIIATAAAEIKEDSEHFELHNLCGLVNSAAAVEIANKLGVPVMSYRVSGEVFGERNWGFHVVCLAELEAGFFAAVDLSTATAVEETTLFGNLEEVSQALEEKFGGFWPLALPAPADNSLTIAHKLQTATETIEDKAGVKLEDFFNTFDSSLGLTLVVEDEEKLEQFKKFPKLASRFLIHGVR